MGNGARKRIQELLAVEEREQAVQLARAVRYRSSPVEITDSGEVVEIETEHFIGWHEKADRESGVTVVEEGVYEMKGDVDFEFSVQAMHDDTRKIVEKEIRDDSETRETMVDPSEQGGAVADGGQAVVEESGTVDSDPETNGDDEVEGAENGSFWWKKSLRRLRF